MGSRVKERKRGRLKVDNWIREGRRSIDITVYKSLSSYILLVKEIIGQ